MEEQLKQINEKLEALKDVKEEDVLNPTMKKTGVKFEDGGNRNDNKSSSSSFLFEAMDI